MTLASDRSHRRSRGRSRPGANDWLDPEDHRRSDLRRWLGRSAIGHVVLLGALWWSPGPEAPRLPGVVTVDLVAMAAAGAPPAAPRVVRAAAPSAAPAELAQPVPAPPKPAPPAPEPAPREAVLPRTPEPAAPKKPKERARPDPEPKPPPVKPAAKAAPPRAPTPPAAPPRAPTPPAPPPRREESYDDVLAGLRAERGEVRPTRVDRAGVQTASAAGVSGATGATGAGVAGAGERIDAEVAVWLRAAKYHVEQAWIMPPGFEREPLRTVVRVRLDAGGRVLGEPRVQQRSGNPWFDESVVRAIEKANPLPPPPDAGDWPFEFTPPGSSG
ncbi:cell envelope integrity protein TolA [Myxococcota bacterium]|nr:cell envelope integrity protein TolA [Myxococcota bacterium]